MASRTTQLRNRLVTIDTVCFYCGLQFNINSNLKCEKYVIGTNRNSSPTLEHVEAIVRGGKTTQRNCVVAHKWCNALVAAYSIEAKMNFKGLLTEYVRSHNCAPWHDKQALLKKNHL